MTRELLFRGFHEDENGSTTIYVDGKAVTGRWVEGMPCYSWEDRTADKGEIKLTKEAYIGCVETLDERHNRILAVIPSTVGQYTGLTDKGGKQAFSGDRVTCSEDHHTVYGTIKFGEIPDDKLKHIGFYIEWENEDSNKWRDWWRNDIGYLLDERCKISGTIFDKEATP